MLNIKVKNGHKIVLLQNQKKTFCEVTRFYLKF